jgi:DNA repair exonuclease SbcCD nuclease subunit
MFRFLHAADIHLDSPLQGLVRYDGAPVDELRGATRRALEKLVSLAIQRQVDFVVIAGDIYDGDWKDHHTGLFFVSQISRLRDEQIPVIMIAGNHDAASKMTKSLRLPDNVQLLSSTEPQTATHPRLAELGVAVHGQSFANAAVTTNLARSYPKKVSGFYNIGVLHTSLEDPQGHMPYAPCKLHDLRQKEYDYWALGHIHHRRIVSQDPLIVFSGNIQGRHIREPSAKGCYLVSVQADGSTELEFQPLDVFRWELCQIDMTGSDRPDDLLSAFSQQLDRLRSHHDALPLAVRVLVEGSTTTHQELVANCGHWMNELRATAISASSGSVWIEKVKFQTHRPADLQFDLTDRGPMSVLLQFMQECRDDEVLLRELADELTDLKVKLPRELIEGPDRMGLDDPDSIRSWLDEVQPLIIGRLADRRAK